VQALADDGRRSRTERIEEEQSAQEEAKKPRTWLVRIGTAADPLALPEVFALDERRRVLLGRRDEEPVDATDRIEVRDRWMSGEHAVLEKTDEGWQLADIGSSNGTLMWGVRRSSAPLADGDIFETGSTFWLFRSMVVSDSFALEPPQEGVLGSMYPPFVSVAKRLRRVARTRVPVMLLGATGTGKEVLARELHDGSKRTGPFLAINTAAVQQNLVASELFGVEKGAHSMADRSRIGQIRAADQGTLLLDEIGDMPLEVQVSLLRVLQESEVVPVGGDAPVKVDVRFICATHQDLDEMVQSGRFRSDLYARLKGTSLEIPTLVERVEDIGLLIGRFLARFDADDLTFSPAAYRALLVYAWPLNIRELEKAVETAIALCDGDRIELEHLPEEVRNYEPPRAKETPRQGSSDASRHRELVRLLTAHGGNVSAVARSMGYSRMQVHRWLKQLQVDPSDYRG
jgi:transcriptional regulator with AAA-type ATPase domain